MATLRITSPRDGDWLTVHDGRVEDRRLVVRVEGVAPPQSTVTVNGTAVLADAGVFCVEVALAAPRDTLVAECGEERVEAVVYPDVSDQRRYRYSTDDNIQFLKDLAANADRYASVFDNPYLAFWRELHEQYGLRVQHNIYYQEPGGFDLTQMPERWKGEWADNADWLKLTFHAEQDEPAKPYLNAGYDIVARDYDKITEQIVRFAGESVLSPYTTVHWAEATYEGCQALRDRGILGLAGYFIADAADAAVGGADAAVGGADAAVGGADAAVGGADAADDGIVPKVAYYHDAETTRHLAVRDAWRDHRAGLWFIKHDVVCNSLPPERIGPHLDSVAANPHRRELMEAMIHEQYFCPFLRHYQPDFKQRVIEAVAWLTEHDYQPVFFEEVFGTEPVPQPVA